MHMDWKSIDTQYDLAFFDQLICWDDSELSEFCGTRQNEDYFPYDISRSGYGYLNLHVLYDVCSTQGKFLHIVLIDCDDFSSRFLFHLSFEKGRVDTLKRVEVRDDWREMRCARMIYRFVSETEIRQHQPYLYRLLTPSEY